MSRRIETSSLPIPVALVITDLDVGGAERALVALATGLDQTRWQPTVFNLSAEGALIRPLCEAGIPAISLNSRRSRPFQVVLTLAKALRRSRPLLIQSFLFHANVAARLARPLAGWPLVVSGLRVAEREQRWHLWLDRLTMPLAAGAVCVSEGVKRFSIETGHLDRRKLTVIPNGIDPDGIDRASPTPRSKLGVPDEAIVALFVGRMERQKGLPVLIEAARAVVARCPDWHLVLVGDGTERQVLEPQTTACPLLSSRVHWLGRRADVPGLLKAADLLVLPSLWEGMPNVVLEAMAAGRAVVATAVEGSSELVVPRQTGWLVPVGKPDDLANALIEAATDPVKLERFGQAGRDRVKQRYTLDAVTAAYDRFWSGLLGIPGEGLRSGRLPADDGTGTIEAS